MNVFEGSSVCRAFGGRFIKTREETKFFNIFSTEASDEFRGTSVAQTRRVVYIQDRFSPFLARIFVRLRNFYGFERGIARTDSFAFLRSTCVRFVRVCASLRVRKQRHNGVFTYDPSRSRQCTRPSRYAHLSSSYLGKRHQSETF